MSSGDGAGVNVGMSCLCTPKFSTICSAISGKTDFFPSQFSRMTPDYTEATTESTTVDVP